MGGEGCAAMYGIPIFLLGEAILVIPGPPTHLVAVRWQDDQAINELSFRVDALEWKNILQNIQAEVPNSRLPIAADAQDLRKEFDVAWQKDLKISLGGTANVARWPPLEAGDYRIVVLERAEERAEIFFFTLTDTQDDRPRALAVAHLTRVPRIATTPTVSFREQDGVRIIDEIRISDVLLGFD